MKKGDLFFGTYKPNSGGGKSNGNDSHVTGTVDETSTNIKTIRGGTKSTSSSTTKSPEQNSVGKEERKSPGKGERKSKIA